MFRSIPNIPCGHVSGRPLPVISDAAELDYQRLVGICIETKLNAIVIDVDELPVRRAGQFAAVSVAALHVDNLPTRHPMGRIRSFGFQWLAGSVLRASTLNDRPARSVTSYSGTSRTAGVDESGAESKARPAASVCWREAT